MTTKDMTYFHQATRQICGSIDIQTVLARCLVFFKKTMPLDNIAMNVYDPKKQSIVNIATAGQKIFSPEINSIPLSPEVGQFIEKNTGVNVEIVNLPQTHFPGRFFWKALGEIDISIMVLKLEIDAQRLGVVVFLTWGNNQYTKEHARLLEMVHDPFAMAMSNALKHKEVLRLKDLLLDDNRYLNRQLRHISGDEIIGGEFGLKYVMESVRQIAPQKSQVLLLGETGVGKEVIANAIHYSSSRASQPFIKVNCGAIPDNLIDSELFGHEKGAFTGALARKRGRFERAHTGTLFLDEIGELPLQVQVRLLRVLQNKEIERVGGSRPIPMDIRIIAATHRDLPRMIREGRFREDLWFRLNVFPITIPPLRQRKSDIPALTRYFMDKKTREMNVSRHPVLAPGALESLENYDWPGNVRELENLVERTIIRTMTGSSERPLEFEPLNPKSGTEPTVPPKTPSCLSDHASAPLLLDEVMGNHIRKVLKMTSGKVQGKNGAAALLGIHHSTLRNRMKKLRIPYGRNTGRKTP